jgi:hypothetical protein
MGSAHVKSLREWNAKIPAYRLPYVAVVVDEPAPLQAADDRRAPTSAKAGRPSSLGGRRSGGRVQRSACT